MYTPDILAFQRFYTSPLGALVCRGLRLQIRERWPECFAPSGLRNEAVVGIGYSLPLLLPFLPKADDPIAMPPVAILPATLGVIPWPAGDGGGGNLCVLGNLLSLPFGDASCDRIVVVHALEFTDRPDVVLQEIERVLKPLGRALVIVPNRLSKWARKETSPFAHGTPFSPLQLERLVQEAELSIVHSGQALFFPPTQIRWRLKLAGWLRHHLRKVRMFGGDARAIPRLLGGGVLVMEVEKRHYAVSPRRSRQSVSPVFAGVAAAR